MAQHGYLREFDEGWDRGDDRERSDRDWRGRDDDWRDRERGGSDRDRNFMIDRDRDRDRDEDRGFFSRARDEARSWLRDDERDQRGDRSAWENNRDYPQRYRGREQGFGGSSESREGRRGASAHPDDHYRSWRDRQMQALDRDYEDYCREREQQFHQDFDSWRQNRPQRQGQQQRGHDQEELILGAARSETEGLAVGAPNERPAMTSPEANATLGTNNSENERPLRGRR
jgi:hypothetical protein